MANTKITKVKLRVLSGFKTWDQETDFDYSVEEKVVLDGIRRSDNVRSVGIGLAICLLAGFFLVSLVFVPRKFSTHKISKIIGFVGERFSEVQVEAERYHAYFVGSDFTRELLGD